MNSVGTADLISFEFSLSFSSEFILQDEESCFASDLNIESASFSIKSKWFHVGNIVSSFSFVFTGSKLSYVSFQGDLTGWIQFVDNESFERRLYLDPLFDPCLIKDRICFVKTF